MATLSLNAGSWLDRRREADRRVRAGAAFLDEHVPDWRDRLDPDVLQVAEDRRCPLALATGRPYAYALGVLGVRAADATRYGFNVRPSSVDVLRDYAALTSAWRRYLRSGDRVTRSVPTVAVDDRPLVDLTASRHATLRSRA